MMLSVLIKNVASHAVCQNNPEKSSAKKTSIISDKNYWKAGDHCRYTGKHRGTEQSICNLGIDGPNENHVVFLNGSRL